MVSTAAADDFGEDEKPRKKKPRKRPPKKRRMPVVEPVSGPQEHREVHAELRSPAPEGGLRSLLKEQYLLRLLVRRELAARYAASLLGLLWSYIRPLLRFVVYYFVFAFILTSRGGGMQYFSLRLFTGIVVVQFFSETWMGGTRSIWANRGLVQKMRMPRETFPVASMLTTAVHTGPQVLILLIGCLIVGWNPDLVAIAAGLLGFAIIVPLSLGLGLLFAALNVFARDFQNIVMTISQFTHFLVPMMYPFARIYQMHENYWWAYQLYMANPMTTVVLLFQRLFWFPVLTPEQQAAIDQPFPPDMFQRGLVMLVVAWGLLWVAQRTFTRLEGTFAERL